MRLFVAVVPPRAALTRLHDAVAGLPTPDGLRWAPTQQWHLTLAFLGEVSEEILARFTQRLERAAGRNHPFELRLGGAGRFGDRVLWAGVQGDRQALRRLAGSVQAASRRAGIPLEERPYRPHLTLARARAGTDLRPLVAALQEFDGEVWTADAVHLVRSRLGAGPGGTALHEIQLTYRL